MIYGNRFRAGYSGLKAGSAGSMIDKNFEFFHCVFVVVELSNMFIDKVKMDVVSDLIDLRPNLHTVILDISVLTYPTSFIADWLFRINRLKLKFLNAQKVEDIKIAFKKMDVDDDGRISTSELSSMCGSGTVPFFNYKYGPDFKVSL